MITIIGTGHVFRIAEPVSFIVKNIWPQAVLVELDPRRYAALTAPAPPIKPVDDGMKNLPKTYRRSAKYQNRVSEENRTETGGELLAAINTANMIRAEVVCIDLDAEQNMKEMEAEMPFWESKRLALSMMSDSLFGMRKVGKTQNDFMKDESGYMADMRRKYPTFIRKLIDERDAHMARRIIEESARFDNMVVVVGDAHVEGICAKLGNLKVNKIRLADLLDPERLEKVKDAVWNDELGKEHDS